MGRILFRFFILLLVITFSFVIYLSYFGIETNKFDSLIKEKANKVNENVKLEFNRTKIHLNPTELNLAVKLKEPKIIIRGNQIKLSKLNSPFVFRELLTSISLFSRFNLNILSFNSKSESEPFLILILNKFAALSLV